MRKMIWVYLKGVAMGAVEVIPGVSSGTIAIITGIYERLIEAIKSFNFTNLTLIFKGEFKTFFKNTDLAFLLCLLLGIASSLFTLAHITTYCLENQPILTWSFFFGLIVASVFFIGRNVKWNWKAITVFLLFAIAAFFITSPENAPLNSSSAYWYIFLCGAIAICAMLLPGISGSFMLVLLGQYYFILNALKTLDVVVLLVFIAGALVGIVSFSNILSWLFKHFKMITYASMTGFMLGALNKIWPWKQTLETYIDKEGIMRALTEKNILPAKFEELTGNPSQLWYAILLLVIGFALIFVIEFVSLKLKKSKPRFS